MDPRAAVEFVDSLLAQIRLTRAEQLDVLRAMETIRQTIGAHDVCLHHNQAEVPASQA